MTENIIQKYKKFNYGSLESFIDSAMEVPLLSLEEETLLLSKSASGCTESSDTLIIAHMKMVVAFAKKYKGYNLPVEDLIQEGNLGLINALKKYDLNSGVRFSSYAIYWIKSAIHEYVMDNSKIMRIATTKAHIKLFFNMNRIRQGFASVDGRVGKLTSEQISIISTELNVEPEDVTEMEKRMSSPNISLISHDEDGDIVDVLDPNLIDMTDPLTKLEESRRALISTHGVNSAIDKLDDRSRKIIVDRFMSDTPKSRIDIGQELSISQQRVAQIENVALKKMRDHLSVCYN